MASTGGDTEIVQQQTHGATNSHFAAAPPRGQHLPISVVEIQLDPLEREAIRLREEWEECARDPFKASPQSKYPRYDLPVDHEEGDRASIIKICSVKRPHMRALHCAWISFFVAFMVWFAPAPLLVEIQTTLKLSKQDLWTSSITNDSTAIFMRIIMGPVCDNYGARLPMSFVLMAASIPTACLGFVNSASGLAVLRFFIGIAGSSFVMSQFWPSRMFSRDIAGTANGTVGGWGNLGGAWTQIFMGTILFPAFRDHFGSAEQSWRTICVIPASIAFAVGAILPFISDDAPMGNYREMKKKVRKLVKPSLLLLGFGAFACPVNHSTPDQSHPVPFVALCSRGLWIESFLPRRCGPV